MQYFPRLLHQESVHFNQIVVGFVVVDLVPLHVHLVQHLGIRRIGLSTRRPCPVGNGFGAVAVMGERRVTA